MSCVPFEYMHVSKCTLVHLALESRSKTYSSLFIFVILIFCRLKFALLNFSWPQQPISETSTWWKSTCFSKKILAWFSVEIFNKRVKSVGFQRVTGILSLEWGHFHRLVPESRITRIWTNSALYPNSSYPCLNWISQKTVQQSFWEYSARTLKVTFSPSLQSSGLIDFKPSPSPPNFDTWTPRERTVRREHVVMWSCHAYSFNSCHSLHIS